MVSLADSIAVDPIDSHTYLANFPDRYCIGSGECPQEIWCLFSALLTVFFCTVPHGGFVTSVFLHVAATHFRTTLSRQNQPHTITLHLEFLRRTGTGPATFRVKDTKLGRQMSTIHVTLSQEDREEVVGYVVNSNFRAEDGLSLDTNFSLYPPPYKVDVRKLRDDCDANWALQQHMPFAVFRKATQNVKFFLPRNGQLMNSLADEWISFKSGEKFTNESLGYVADTWPQVVESYREELPGVALQKPDASKGNKPQWARFWYPTVLLNLDVKKELPAEGVEWLFVRVRAKQIKNGRMDLEVVIMDEAGDIVALSNHVALILSAERNMASRRTAKGEQATKL